LTQVPDRKKKVCGLGKRGGGGGGERRFNLPLRKETRKGWAKKKNQQYLSTPTRCRECGGQKKKKTLRIGKGVTI